MQRLLFFLFWILSVWTAEAQTVIMDSLERILSISKKEDTTKVKLLGKLSWEMQKVNLREAVNYANQQVELAGRLKYITGLANGYNNLGAANMKLGNYREALDQFNRALRIYETMQDERLAAMILNNIGAVYSLMGEYDIAAGYSLEALKKKEKSGSSKSIASSFINVGVLYYKMGNFDKAKSYFTNALEINRKIGYHTGIADCLINMGEVERVNKNYEAAAQYFSEALDEAGRDENLEMKSRARLSLGICYLYQKRYINAIKSLQSSLDISQTLQDKETTAQNLKNIGKCYRETNEPDSSVFYLKQALNYAGEIGAQELLQECYIELSETYSAKREFENALDCFKRYSVIKDSVYNIDKTNQVTLYQIKFETEKKDNEIKLLGKTKEIQQAVIEKEKARNLYMMTGFALLSGCSFLLFLFYNQKKKIAIDRQVSRMEMKALRSQMNPHFIFNSLNSINKFISQKNPEQASDYLVKFSKLMRLILENSRYQEVPLEKDLNALELYMQLESYRLNQHFTYEIKIDPAIDAEITLIPPLILQPFVENAIWHGLQHTEDKGKITIEIVKEGEMIHCIVEDNGIGRVRAREVQAAEAGVKSESLGVKITMERISILNKIKKASASVQLADLARGVRVIVKLPLELSF